MEPIPNVKNVRAICSTGNGFVLIRNNVPTTEVFIDFYTDRSSSEMLKKYKKISIGWNEKWSFLRDEEKSKILIVRLESNAIVDLFSHFVDEDAEEATNMTGGYTKVVVFSINSSLFCIFYENAKNVQSGISSIRTFVAEIHSFLVFPSGILCILLTSGVINVLYVDKEGGLGEETICTGLQGIHTAEGVLTDDCVYITDRELCVKISFSFDSEDLVLSWTTDKINLRGVVGISYIPINHTVLVLTENYSIYAIDHVKKVISATEDNLIDDKSDTNSKIDTLQKSLLDLSTANRNLTIERSKSMAINVLLNPKIIQDNCKVIFNFQSIGNYNEMPNHLDNCLDQLFHVNLEFQCESELESIFQLGLWNMGVVVSGVPVENSYQETIRLDKQFLRSRRVNILRDRSRNVSTLGADFDVAIEGLVKSAEKLFIKVPLRVAYNFESIVEVLEEDPQEIAGSYGFKMEFQNASILNKLLDMLIAERMHLEPFVIAVGQSPIVITPEDTSCTFKSDNETVLHLLKKLLIAEGHNRNIWTKITIGAQEAISVSFLKF